MVDLIAHASEVLAERPSERVNAPVLLSMMLDHIDRHSDDPELGAATLARKFRCSERYVHRLFAKHGPLGRRTRQRQADSRLHARFS